jgi:hypothetical protein
MRCDDPQSQQFAREKHAPAGFHRQVTIAPNGNPQQPLATRSGKRSMSSADEENCLECEKFREGRRWNPQ